MKSTGTRFGALIKFLFILIVLAVILVAVIPLNLYYSQIEDHLKPVRLQGISGSVVKGEAEELNYLGMQLGHVDWLLYPNSHKSLGGKVRLNKDHHDVSLNVGKISQDSVHIKGVRGFLDWELIKPFVQMRYGQLSGYASLNLNNLMHGKNTGIERLSGDIVLRDFKMLKPSVKDLGTVTLTFETKSKGMVIGTFSSDSQALNVSGSLFLQPNRWQLNLDIIPRAGHFELDAILNSVGDARRGGGRSLNLAGFY